MNPVVSVIIPVYNASKYLTRCLESVLGQSYRNIELILVDDGSSDNSLAICKKFAASDSRIVVVSKKNAGVSAARNRGVQLARGAFLTFVDADDWIDSNICEIFVESLKNGDYDLFCYSAIYHGKKDVKSFLFGDDLALLSQKQRDELHCKVMSPYSPEFDYSCNTRFAGSVWGKFYRTEILKREKLFFSERTIISEDVLFNVLALDSFERIGYTTKAFYHYQQSSASAQNRYRRNTMKYFNFIIGEIQSWLSRTDKNQLYHDCANSLFVHYLFGSLKEDYFHRDNPDKYLARSEFNFVLNQEKFQLILKNVKSKYFSFSERVLIFLLKERMSNVVEWLIKAYNAVEAVR